MGVLRPEVYTHDRLMHRRPLGNGRRLAFLGAIVVLVGCLLPWYTVGGDGGLPPSRAPRIRRDRDRRVPRRPGDDRPDRAAVRRRATGRSGSTAGLAFGLLAVRGAGRRRPVGPGVLEAPEGLLPDRAYGFWIAVVGAIMLARAAYDISLEPPRR